MILLKTALKNLRKDLGLNIIVFSQLVAALIIAAVMVSSLYLRFRSYLPFRDYFESQGVASMSFIQYSLSFYDSAIHSPEELSKITSAEEFAAIYGTVAQYDPNIKDEAPTLPMHKYYLSPLYYTETPEAYFYDDELLKRYSPDIVKGRMPNPEASELEAAIPENMYGLETGDSAIVWMLSDDGKSFFAHKVKIVGEYGDKSPIFGAGKSWSNADHRIFYKYTDDPIMIMSYSVLQRQATKIGTAVGPCAFLKYAENTPEEVMAEDIKTLSAAGGNPIFRFSEIDKNSKKYLYEEVYQLMPIIILLMILIIVGCVSGSAISTRRRINDYAVYYITGLPWRKCVLINLLQSVILTASAAAASVFLIIIIQNTGLSENIVVFFNSWMIASFCVIAAIYIIFSMIMPIIMLSRTTPKQILTR